MPNGANIRVTKHRFSFDYVLAFGITNAIIFVACNAEVVINISVSGNKLDMLSGETNELSDYINNIGILVDNMILIM